MLLSNQGLLGVERGVKYFPRQRVPGSHVVLRFKLAKPVRWGVAQHGRHGAHAPHRVLRF